MSAPSVSTPSLHCLKCGHTLAHHAGNSFRGRCCVKPCTCARFRKPFNDFVRIKKS